MKYRTIILTILFPFVYAACGEEQKPQPAVEMIDESRNQRLIDLNPNAWKDLPMKVVISDFQESDGIFSSFICDELTSRMIAETSKSLKSLDSIDRNSRVRAFKICLHSEAYDSSKMMKAVNSYTEVFPELVEDIVKSANN